MIMELKEGKNEVKKEVKKMFEVGKAAEQEDESSCL